jgi:hypothetical protein
MSLSARPNSDWYGMIAGRLGYAWGAALLLSRAAPPSCPASVLDQCASAATDS